MAPANAAAWSLPSRQRHVDVVLIRSAADGEEDATRAAQLDHLPPELGHGVERRAAETEEPVPTLHADARRRAAGAHAAHDQAVLGARGRDAEELPGELVGACGLEGGGGQADLLVAAVAPERQRDPVALGVVLDALLELLSPGHPPPVPLGDPVAAPDARTLARGSGSDLGPPPAR